MPDVLSRLLGVLRRNWPGKVAALVLATATWYGIQSVINFEARIREVPVNLILPEGWEVLDLSPPAVEVVFRGSEQDLRFLNRDQVKINLDLRGRALNGTNLLTRYRIQPRHVSAPAAVRPLLIRPEEITFTLDRQEEKVVPVKVETQGLPAEGFEMEQKTCTPLMVKITGPRSRLMRTDTISTVPVDLEGRTRSFKKARVPLQLPAGIALANPENGFVAVEVTLVENATTAVWPDVPVRVLLSPEAPESRRVMPPVVTVSVRGRAEIMKKMDARDLRVFADGSELEKPGTYELPVRVHAPPGLTVVRTEPSIVSVTLGER